MMWFVLGLGVLLAITPAAAQLFFPIFPPPVSAGPPPVVTPAGRSLFIMNRGSVAILNGISQ